MHVRPPALANLNQMGPRDLKEQKNSMSATFRKPMQEASYDGGDNAVRVRRQNSSSPAKRKQRDSLTPLARMNQEAIEHLR